MRASARAKPSTGATTCGLLPVERQFLYLPFEHSEDLDDQDYCVERMATLEAFEETRGLVAWAAEASRDHPPLRPLPPSQRGPRARVDRGGARIPLAAGIGLLKGYFLRCVVPVVFFFWCRGRVLP